MRKIIALLILVLFKYINPVTPFIPDIFYE